MYAYAEIIRETDKSFIVKITETGEQGIWPKYLCEEIGTGVFNLRGWLANAHAKHLVKNGYEVAA